MEKELIKQRDISEQGGNGLLELYGDSLLNMLKNQFPTYNWEPWKFTRTEKGTYHNKENQRKVLYQIFASYIKLFDYVATQLNMKSLDDWYSVQKSEVMRMGLTRIITDLYGGSIGKAVMSVYPGTSIFHESSFSSQEHNWNIHKFHAPVGYWQDKKNQREFFESLGKKLGIKKWEDWCNFFVKKN